jgi:hypothetical protein
VVHVRVVDVCHDQLDGRHALCSVGVRVVQPLGRYTFESDDGEVDARRAVAAVARGFALPAHAVVGHSVFDGTVMVAAQAALVAGAAEVAEQPPLPGA